MADRTYDPRRPLVRDDDRVLVSPSSKPIECSGTRCSEYVLKTQLCFRHKEVVGETTHQAMFHGPCWIQSDPRPKNKALSDYEGFGELASRGSSRSSKKFVQGITQKYFHRFNLAHSHFETRHGG